MLVDMRKNEKDQYWQLYWPCGEPVKCECDRQVEIGLFEVPTKENATPCGKIKILSK